MCFSATSSFVVATGLAATGIAALKYAPKKNLIPLALIPLGFAVQQVAEGVVWLTLDQPASLLHRLAIYVFLTVAFVIWPVWAPYAVKMYEPNPTRKKIVSLLQLAGLMFAIFAAFVFATSPVHVSVIKGHLAYYVQHFLFSAESSIAWYFIPTILPFFVASNRIMARIIGVLLLLALVATYFFAPATLASIWCFFAAVISIGVIGLIWSERKRYGA